MKLIIHLHLVLRVKMETYLHGTEHHVVVHKKTQGQVIYVRQLGSVDMDCMQLVHVEIGDRFFQCGDELSCFGRNRIDIGVSAYQRKTL